MTQLPETNDSLMDEIKVNTNSNSIYDPLSSKHESKQSMDDFDDNDSLKNHVDAQDYPIDSDLHHTIISNRDNAPPPLSSLTLASLQHVNDETPPQYMLSAVDSGGGRTGTGTSSQPQHDLNLGDIMQLNTVPDLLITPLIEMGFSRCALSILSTSARIH